MTEQKKGRGRPVINDVEILDGIKKSPEKTKSLDAFTQNVEHYLKQIEGAQLAAKDVVAEASDTLGLSKAFIMKLAKTRLKGDQDEQLAKSEALVEAIELTAKKGSEEF